VFEARPYQKQCVCKVLEDWEKAKNEDDDGSRSVLITVPTGGGKTHIMGELIANVTYPEIDSGKKARVLVLVHRDELLQQAIEKISAHLNKKVTVGKVNSETKEMEADVVFAMVGSLVGHLDELQKASEKVGYIKYVFTDEAHHAYAKSWGKIYDKVKEWNDGDWYHAGVTATPMRLNANEKLSDVFPKISFAISIFDLISSEYLVPFKGITVGTKSLDNLSEIAPKNEGQDFQDAELDDQLSKDIPFLMTVVSSYLKHAKGRKAIVFCAGQGEAEAMSRLFNMNHIKSGYIHGNMKLKERRENIRMYGDGRLDVLCNCMVLAEGFDETSVNAVLLARPTRSLALYIQMLGRGLRLHEGKKDCVVIDFHGISEVEELSFRKLADVLEFYGMTVAAKVSRKRKKKKEDNLENEKEDDDEDVRIGDEESAQGLMVEELNEKLKSATGEGLLNDDNETEIVINEESIEAMEELQSSFENKCTKGVEEFGLSIVSEEIEDAASLQEYPWFIHTGIETVEFIKSYSIMLMPSPIGTKEDIASRLRKLKLIPYVVSHQENDQWFSKLSKGAMGRAAARMKANLFIRYFGDKKGQSPKNKWRSEDVDAALLMEGYKLSAELNETFPIPIPFRQRSINRGVSVDMINAMKCIKIIQMSDAEKSMSYADAIFRKKLLEELEIADIDGVVGDPCKGMTIDLKAEKKEIVRKAVFIIKKKQDPDVIAFIEGCEVSEKNETLIFQRKARADSTPLHVSVIDKINLQVSKAVNVIEPGTLISVKDDENVIHEFTKAMAEKQKIITKEIYEGMLQ